MRESSPGPAGEHVGCCADTESHGEVLGSPEICGRGGQSEPENAGFPSTATGSPNIALRSIPASPGSTWQRPGPEALRAALAMLNAPIPVKVVPTARAKPPRRTVDAALATGTEDKGCCAAPRQRQQPIVELAALACRAGDNGAGIYQTFQKQQVPFSPLMSSSTLSQC
jgi:hypothetical protein